MAIVGDVSVTLRADAQKFISDVGKASKKYESFGQSLKKVGKVMTAGVTAPILGATAALGAMILSTTKAADQILLMSQRSGISTGTLQELAHVGNITGVSIETLANSSSILTRNLSDAANGIGEAKDTVQALGIQLTDSNGAMLSQETLLLNSLDALAGMSNKTEQAAATMELFGRAGKDLLPILAEGQGSVAKLREEAHTLGLVMGGETIAALDALDSDLAKLGGSFTGVANKIVAGFLPIIKGELLPFINDSLIPAIVDVGEFLGNMAKGFSSLSTPIKVAIGLFVGLLAAVGPVMIAMGAYTAILPLLAANTALVSAATWAWAAAVAVVTSPITIVIAAVVALGAALLYFSDDVISVVGKSIDFLIYDVFGFMIDMMNQWSRGVNDIFGTSIGQIENFKKSGETMGESFSNSANSVADNLKGMAIAFIFGATAVKELKVEVEDAADGVDKLKTALIAIPEPFTTFNLLAGTMAIAMTGADEALARTNQSAAIMQERIAGLSIEMNDFVEKPRIAGDAFAWMGENATPVGDMIGASMARAGNGLLDMAVNMGGLKKATDLMINSAKGLLKELIKMAAKKALFKLLNIGSGGTLGIAGKIGKVFGFAKGGIISEPTAMLGLHSGRRGIMGEAGAEAIVPLTGGKRGGGGGMALTVNVYGSVGVDDIGDQIINKLRRAGLS